MQPERNGSLRDVVDGIKGIEHRLVDAVEGLTSAVNLLSSKVDNLVIMYKDAVPIKVVWWMFIILMGSLLGVEGVKTIFQGRGLP